jgi:hypothetical protein
MESNIYSVACSNPALYSISKQFQRPDRVGTGESGFRFDDWQYLMERLNGAGG